MFVTLAVRLKLLNINLTARHFVPFLFYAYHIEYEVTKLFEAYSNIGLTIDK